jgi:hypothetical protein
LLLLDEDDDDEFLFIDEDEDDEAEDDVDLAGDGDVRRRFSIEKLDFLTKLETLLVLLLLLVFR